MNDEQLLSGWFGRWQAGQPQQEAVLTEICTLADERPKDAWPLALACWLGYQLGEPGLRTVLPYAERAIEAGIPWAATNVVANAISNPQAWPDLFQRAVPLLSAVSVPAMAIDQVGQAWNLLSQSRSKDALELLTASATPRFLFAPSGSEVVRLGEELREAVREIRRLESEAHSAADVAAAASTSAQANIQQIESDLRTRAKQTEVLVDTVTSATVNERFDDEARKNERESRTLFRMGTAVLIAAALVALLPVLLHYLGFGPEYSSTALLAAHTTVTLSFAAVAGVLLARARGRDRARQRARDLSTAMGTIITYSGQIADPGEKQRFMQTMGQLVLVAHLQADKSGDEQVSVGLANILAAVKSPPTA